MTSEIASKNTSREGDGIDLGRLIGELIDFRKLIITITAVFTVLAVLYAFMATPVYQSDALIQVEQKQGNALISSLSQILPDGEPQSAPEITLLQSRMILGKTVEDLHLQANVEQNHFPLIGRGLARMMGNKDGELNITHLFLPKVDSKDPKVLLKVVDDNNYIIESDNFSLKGRVGESLESNGISILVTKIKANPGTEFTVTYLSKYSVIDDLQQRYSVTDMGKDTGMLSLNLTGTNASLNSRILDSISKNYLEQNVERQAAQDAKSLEFLDKQLPKVRSDLDTAEDKLNTYRKQQDSVDLTMEAKAVLDQIVNVDNQLNELTFKEAEISQLYTQEHPTYKALLEKRQTLQEEKNKLNKRVSSMPATQQEVLRLSRDVESGRAVYLQLLNRQQELSISKSSAIGNVRIIDDAVAKPDPVRPKKAMIIISGFILGVFISIVIVLLRVSLRKGIETPEQLEEMGINVYAIVPMSEASVKNGSKVGAKDKHQTGSLLAIDNPADLAIEAIRSLRTSMQFAMMGAKNNILMISGASPSAGKTFVSSNLASIMALGGQKVLFIDADMRKGYAHKLFGFEQTKGLFDILSGLSTTDEIIKKVPEAGFDYIPRGQVPKNPSELLMNPKFDALMKTVSEEYDLVILDTPPILAVTDAAVIGKYVGTTILVARFEVDTVKAINVSLKRFEQAGIKVNGCVLNGILKRASSYYAYGYSHYGYSYSDKN